MGKPNWQKTLRERINQARRANNLYKRPHTDDWLFWDMLGEIERLTRDSDRCTRKPKDR